jgi:hypothetical protein
MSLRNVLAVQFAGNAVLLWLGYYWLGVGESRAAVLAWSALTAFAIVCLACWLHGSAFAFFAQPKAGLRASAGIALRRLPALIVLAIVVAGVYLLVDRLTDPSRTAALRVASYLTMTLRRPVKPSWIAQAFGVLFWVVRWAIVPVLFLPMIAAVASRGWSGFRSIGALRRRRLYWLQVPILLVCAFWVPFRLLGWVPAVHGFSLEMASFVVRAATAYLLFVGAWLLLVFVTSAGTPLFVQPKTVPSP